MKGEPEHVGHNGDAGSVGVNGVMDSVGETDSEAEEEFCDTSDLPQQLPVSIEYKLDIDIIKPPISITIYNHYLEISLLDFLPWEIF